MSKISTTPWHGVISDEDVRRYEAAGFGRRSGWGKKPALLIVDVQYRTTGTSPQPFWAAIEEFTTSCGDVAWASIRAIRPIMDEFRARRWPIIYPHVAPKIGADRNGRLAEKVPSLLDVPPHGYEFVSELAPEVGDLILPKRHPSAFFGTPLASDLVGLEVDTLIVTGCTTSGCIRGTVVDAFSHNMKVIVPYDCVYDRSATAHAVSLFDMSEKYADVMSSEETIAQSRAL